MLKKIFPLLIGIGLLSTATHAAPSYGVNFSYVGVAKDPNNLHGYRVSFLYQPQSWIWNKWRVFIDTSAGHWWVNSSDPYHMTNIYSVAPVLRYYIIDGAFVSPFLDASIGASYADRTHINDKNLGIHFVFQDQIGIGAAFGKDKNLTASITTMHYSNGSLSKINSGMTIPVMLNMAYWF